MFVFKVIFHGEIICRPFLDMFSSQFRACVYYLGLLSANIRPRRKFIIFLPGVYTLTFFRKAVLNYFQAQGLI